MWDILFKVVYVVLSSAVVFVPLIALFPAWYNVIPYYRKATKSVERLYNLSDDEIYEKGEKEEGEIQLGIINRGERGFNELLEAITANAKKIDINVTKIILMLGDIQVPFNASCTPNMAIFIQDNTAAHTRIPVIYDPMDQNSLYNVRHKLVNWIRTTTQFKMTRYAFIVTVVWVAITTIYVLCIPLVATSVTFRINSSSSYCSLFAQECLSP